MGTLCFVSKKLFTLEFQMPRGQKLSYMLATSYKILVTNTTFLVTLMTSQSQFLTQIMSNCNFFFELDIKCSGLQSLLPSYMYHPEKKQPLANLKKKMVISKECSSLSLETTFAL